MATITRTILKKIIKIPDQGVCQLIVHLGTLVKGDNMGGSAEGRLLLVHCIYDQLGEEAGHVEEFKVGVNHRCSFNH